MEKHVGRPGSAQPGPADKDDGAFERYCGKAYAKIKNQESKSVQHSKDAQQVSRLEKLAQRYEEAAAAPADGPDNTEDVDSNNQDRMVQAMSLLLA
jgi:hypothetical protein